MSDYKEIELDVEIKDREILIQVLQLVLGACAQSNGIDVPLDISQDTKVTNTIHTSWQVYHHTHNVAMSIREEQLPPHLRGYGDIGVVEKNGKFTFLAINPNESHYVDEVKRREAQRTGNQEAVQFWQDGAFARETESFLREINNAYGALSESIRIQQEMCPEMSLGTASPVAANEPGGWGVPFSIPDEVAKRLVATQPL